ncbi:MAG: serine/threonine protein kinase, partial [Phycisphaerales bacterium]|nr:serine/threonine protein kinase [Phycisphaerales bacterium]
KVLLEAPDPTALARFQLEAAVASKLRHPGIVGVLDVGVHQGLPYLVLEYCRGQTLGAWLRSNPHPELREAVELVAQLARAAGFAHRQGVLHRDLKPANVILAEPDGRPRITDFGVARDRSLQRSMTRTGDVLGTPAYMAPEQLSADPDLVTARADVYALGVLLYELLTGTRPFDAQSLIRAGFHELLRVIREDDPPKP